MASLKVPTQSTDVRLRWSFESAAVNTDQIGILCQRGPKVELSPERLADPLTGWFSFGHGLSGVLILPPYLA